MTQPEPTVREDIEAVMNQPNPLADPPDLMDRLIAAMAPPDLDALVDELEDGGAQDALEAWQIADLDAASWAARHLARRRERIAEIVQLAQDQAFRIAQWKAEETARLEADAAFFEGRLHAFHERALVTDPRAKTIKLPDGTELRSQAGKLAVEVEDLEQFSRWAEENGRADDLLRMGDPQPNKVEIAKAFSAKAEAEKDPGEYPAIVAETGETVPGVIIVRKPRTFTVSTEQPT